MRFHKAVGLGFGAGLLAMLSACGDGSKQFTTEGLIAPPIHCLTDPRILGEAERLDPIDEGNGCQVPNPWRMHSVAGVQFSQPATLNRASPSTTSTSTASAWPLARPPASPTRTH